jgi:hypothetical protein
MGVCEKCGKFFQYTVAVREITPSNSGEINSGSWKIICAPSIEEIHPNGGILYRSSEPEQPDDGQPK